MFYVFALQYLGNLAILVLIIVIHSYFFIIFAQMIFLKATGSCIPEITF